MRKVSVIFKELREMVPDNTREKYYPKHIKQDTILAANPTPLIRVGHPLKIAYVEFLRENPLSES